VLPITNNTNNSVTN